MTFTPYVPRRVAKSRFAELRGLRHHLIEWGDPALASPERPTLVMLHGWMDVAASFQFVVDALAEDRHIVSIDWRGFGLTERPSADSYWFADYLGDLDALLDSLNPPGPIDLLGHSMGGNVVSMYAGIRPERIRRLINLEGFGLPASKPENAPATYARWLDELKQPARMRTYDSVEQVAQRLQQNNPLLPADRAAWLAPHWSRRRDDGQWEILGDPAHKRRNPVQYQVQEVLACWKRITAPVLWVEGDQTDQHKRWGENYTRADFDERLNVLASVEKHLLAPAGHMLHHDQPEALAAIIERFLA